jgi:misacylated tRNA(Ala) deacylase
MVKDHYPPMHSVEHILNQTMVRLFQCGRSVNAHIEKKKSRIDYSFNRDLSDDEITIIENSVNTVIQKNLPVFEEWLERTEAETQYNLGKLPEGSGNTIRIIKIGDYDACPCSGVHVTSTSEIGTFKIFSKSYENRILRLRFKLEQ